MDDIIEVCNGVGWCWAPINKSKHFCGVLASVNKGVAVLAGVESVGSVPYYGGNIAIEDANL